MSDSRAELVRRLRAKLQNDAHARQKQLTPAAAVLKLVSHEQFVSIRGVVAALRSHTQFPEFFDACMEPRSDPGSHAVAERLVRLGPEPDADQIRAIVAAVPRGRPPYTQPVPKPLVDAATKMLHAHSKIPPTAATQPNDLTWCRRWIDFALDDAKIESPLLQQMRTAHQQLV